jgi:muramoyltetrapeptide carboxypeptidase
MSLSRRLLGQSLIAAGAGLAGASQAAALTATARPAPLYPRRLQPGDTLALVSPAKATFEREPYAIATEALQALGFKVREAPNLRARWGKFGGTDEQRAADLNAMFADDTVQGIVAMTGGSGCNRIVDKLDYRLIAAKPKYFGGFSDITCLLNAMQRQTGLVSFHAPVAESEWNAFSVAHWRALVMEGQAPLLKNPTGERGDNLVQKDDRTSTLRGGRARGPLVGGNLAVLASLAGTPYFPDCRGAILFLEEINEYIYRVERMLSTLRLCGALSQLSGVVIGKFTKCEPGDGFASHTLDEVFDDYFLPLNVPVYRGAMIGHIRRKFTVPVGAEAEIDADAGTLQILRPVVR